MESQTLCFCGSGRPHEECHGHIHPDSLVARVYALQSALDEETARRGGYPGGDLCCGRSFAVSEAEFVQILDELLHTGRRSLIGSAARRAKARVGAGNTKDLKSGRQESVFEIISALVREPLLPGDGDTEFACPLADGEGRCPVYAVRPLSCRLSGGLGGRVLPAEKPCRRKPGAFAVPPENAELEKLLQKILGLSFLPDGSRYIVRRPERLAWYFSAVFRDESLVSRLEDADFYRLPLTLGESDYIRALTDADSPIAGGR